MESIGRTGRRTPSLGEEIANAVSHGVGLLAVLAGAPFLLLAAGEAGPRAVVGAAVFVGAAAALYLTSTLYHALAPNRAKRVLRVLDHGAIFLLIAGTYTPFTLGVLRGAWGWSLLGVIWGLAVLGIVLESTGLLRRRAVAIALYATMGWIVLVAARPLLDRLPLPGLAWLAAGGAAYTLGIFFYAARGRRYAHLVWHLFVIAGTACHYVAVLRYA